MGQGPGFIEHHGVDVGQSLQGLQFTHHDPRTRQTTRTGEHGGRGGE
jgi:hypothetical protein